MNPHFPEIKKNFGFGMMRLPMNGDRVDFEATNKMVDAFIEAGFNYFDTAHTYIQGQSEEAIRRCVSSRYPREAYLLANKLTPGTFQTEEDIRPVVDLMLEKCGVEYFDFFLMHAMGAERHEFYTSVQAYDIAQELKAEGKLRHVGMSFHDSPEVLDKILTERPELEFVQLQFNYVDYEDLNVAARRCYEVCCKHGKPVLVMEPVKGGRLVELPREAKALLTGGSPASYAIRFAAGFEQVAVVLSGMSNMEQVEDNLSYMTDFKPLTEAEHQIISQVRTLYQAQNKIPCTGCAYCVDGCPAGIPIPDIFAAVNAKIAGEGEPEQTYAGFSANGSDCLRCGLCEQVCPQHLHIRELLEKAHQTLG